MWKKAEKELDILRSSSFKYSNIETELITQANFLSFGDKDSEFISNIMLNFPKMKWLSADEIMKTYPGIHNLPKDYIGFIHEDAGIVKAKNAINGFKILSEENGATLQYNSKVIEAYKNKVKLENGEVFYSKHVVVCWGAYTTELFDKGNKGSYLIEGETFSFSGIHKDLPGWFIEASKKYEAFGLMDGQDLKSYKISLDDESRNLKNFMAYARERFPEKLKYLTHVNACFYTYSEDDEYKYKTGVDGVHYCYELGGTGFKYMPIHGKIIYDALITKEDKHFVCQTRAKL